MESVKLLTNLISKSVLCPADTFKLKNMQYRPNFSWQPFLAVIGALLKMYVPTGNCRNH